MRRKEAEQYRNKVVQAEQLERLGGMNETIEQSDKIGYDWRCYAVGGVVVRREYVEQDNPVGTADNPFEWQSGMKLIPNGYYSNNGKRYVAVKDGSPDTVTDEYLVEF